MSPSPRGAEGGRRKALRIILSVLGAATAIGACAGPAAGQRLPDAPFAYQVPPQPIARVLEAAAPPFVLLSPSRDRIALLARPGLPPIAELAEPELGLAGATINPANNGPSRTSGYSGITFTDLDTGKSRAVRLPADARLISPIWSPDGRRLAFLILDDESVELWSADADTGQADRRAQEVNAAFAKPFEWLPDSTGLLVRLVPARRGAAPEADAAPRAPVIRESPGREAPGGTVQNLLSNPHEEALFEHYFTSRLAVAALDGGAPQPFGEPGLIAEAQVSPDGRFVLQHRLKRPFSYSVPAGSFPTEIFVTDRSGNRVARIGDHSATDPAKVPSGPRAVRWRADAPATLFWTEKAAGGEARDRLYLLDAPFRGPPRLLAETEHRFQDILWGRDDLAVMVAISPEERAEYRLAVDPSRSGTPRILQKRAFRGGGDAGMLLEWAEDRLHLAPGGTGLFVKLRDGLGRLDLRSGRLVHLWKERPGESLFGLLDRDGERLLAWREGRTRPPNLFVTRRGAGSATRITDIRDPAPEYAGMQLRPVTYRRKDGRPLRGRLYLPDGYDPRAGGPLPTLVWAYPASITGDPAPAAPGQASERFERPQGFDDLPLLLTARGYAVFEAAMPIFGTEDSPPNDTHIAQLVANAEAAVEALVGLGVSTRDRIAIGGHSYGAAMAANLLAHSDLFRTGIAFSGAYNRTLTPFGFQASERRSFWEAPEVYLSMSPFVHADRIREPILLVHGAADTNSGTYPMQSERFYAALSATGGTVRYVLLPAEGHQYRARESLMHVMWEVDRWLTTHLN